MNHKLSYNRSALNWNEALPLGNGSLGAMVYGGSDLEIIQLNHDTFWSGMPYKEAAVDKTGELARVREQILKGSLTEAQETANSFLEAFSAAYLPVGSLYIKPAGMNGCGDYKRELSLDTAELTVQHQMEKNVICEGRRERFTLFRNYIVSYPHDVMMIRLSSNGKNGVSFSLFGESDMRHEARVQGNVLKIGGFAPSRVHRSDSGEMHPFDYEKDSTVSFALWARVETEGGALEALGNKLSVYSAESAVIYISLKTNFKAYNILPDPSLDLDGLCAKALEAAFEDGPEEILRRHVNDYQSLYNRVSLSLGSGETASEPAPEFPTDERLRTFKTDPSDLRLIETVFNYGRYLMIAGSRKGTQPLNLQGIWSNYLQPPWNSNYTTNINTEMNYWPAEICNLGECHEPLFKMTEELMAAGAKTARVYYGAEGFTVHHNTDLWRKTTPAAGVPKWSLWPMAGGWLCRHLWDHYEYTGDRGFLKERAYPVMREAVRFFLDFLVEDEEGYYVTCPSTSPENAFYYEGGECQVTKASTMDMAIIRELFENFLFMIKDLSKKGEEENGLEARVRELLPRLYPYHVGTQGQLLEYDREFDEKEKGHRHVSHLYGLYPGNEINKDTPELFGAARRSLEIRLANGGGHTGWSCGWIICLFARLHDGEQAERYIHTLLKRSLYANLFDAHPPFQIDGNFGFTAGIAEMLLQSRRDGDGYVLNILPALPASWKKGEVKGLRAKGGFEVSIKWSERAAPEVEVKSLLGNRYRIENS